MFAYIGIFLMLAGIMGIIATAKSPRRFVVWSALTMIIMQAASFIVFSGIVQKSAGLMWIGAGVFIGAICSIFVKMEKRENNIFYRQNLLFALSYMFLLLINQLIALFFRAYIPAVLYIAALAVGMQIGLNVVMILKAKKIRKIQLYNTVLCIIILLFTFLPMAGAFEDKSAKLEGTWEMFYTVDINNVSENEKTKLVNTLADEWTIFHFYDGLVLNGLNITSDVDADTGNLEFEFDNLGYKYKFITGVSQNGKEMAGYFYINDKRDPSVTYVAGRLVARNTVISSLENNNDSMPPSSVDTLPTNGSESNSDKDAKKDNIFIPQAVPGEDAEMAAALSGLLAGVSALISLISSLTKDINLQGISLPNPPYPVDIPNSPNSSLPTAPPSPIPASPPMPPIGTRREDGKIFTKNHGWQNENWPEISSNSIKKVISSLESDIQRHSQSGDKLRAEIAKDEMKRNMRELKGWEEDIKAVKRAQTFDNEQLLQDSAKRRDTYSGQIDDVIWYTNAVGFASDIALAVSTSGAAPALTSAKKTLESLSLAKEIIGAATEGYVNKENLSVTITKFGINKGVSMGVGKAFDAGKLKYDVDNSASALKAFVGAGESSAGSVAQKISEESGLTGKITDTVNTADNFFKDRAKGISDIGDGGAGQ